MHGVYLAECWRCLSRQPESVSMHLSSHKISTSPAQRRGACGLPAAWGTGVCGRSQTHHLKVRERVNFGVVHETCPMPGFFQVKG